MASKTTPPVSATRLKQIANDACESALANAEFYDHSKTAQWNETIINSMLKALIAEASSPSASSLGYKFAVNSTIVQHLVPSSSLNKPRGGGESEDASSSSPPAGRRGMHSATGAYWNEKTDGMWSYKYEGGEKKGLDIVIMVIWIAV